MTSDKEVSMAEFVSRQWSSDLEGAGLSRRDRRPCRYDSYIPDPLVGRRFLLEGGVAADVADAEAAIVRLNAEATALVGTEALARILLRAEAVASSRIEGLEIGARRLLHPEAVRVREQPASDVTATEILNDIDATVAGLDALGPGDPITVDLILEMHRRLLAGTRLEDHGGRIRDQQNWIGGSSYNPCSAAFVPPPPELVPGLLEDLCSFCIDEWVHGLDPNFTIDLYTVYGWASAELYVDALKKAGPTPTQASHRAALKTETNFDADHMLAPANPAGKVPATCYVLAQIVNGEFQRVDMPKGSLYRCDGPNYTPPGS